MRIASIAKSNTEILKALGCGEEIIAATNYDEGNFERIGSYVDIDVKKIVSLMPDIVFSSTFLQKKFAEQLESEGLRVAHFDPLSVDGIMGSILEVGKITGKKGNAEKIVSGMRGEIRSIRKLVSAFEPLRVYCEEWPSPPMAAGNWVVQMIRIAGGTGILKQGERSRKVNLEEVTSFSPEKIVLNWCGTGLNAKKEVVEKRKGWKKIGAVKTGRIFVVDDSLFNTPSHRIVLGIKELARVLHNFGQPEPSGRL